MIETWFIGLALAAAVQTQALGTIDFPSSASEEAREPFLQGVLLLHSFEWEDAAEAFQRAQKIDHDFALAYWGEALSYTGGHHFPPQQDMAKARAALQKLGRTREERLAKAPTDRERGYLEAVELLYGAGDAQERALAYSEAMGRLSARYPQDYEAAVFHALSLMRTRVRGAESLREDMKAGAIAQAVLRENPDHPGAAHFVIHAYDDPIHAPIALYAAHKYAEIAPAAVHALHMPAHIFVQHGMWDYVASSNEASWKASKDRARLKGLSPTKYSFHALYWLQYAYLQQGRYQEAQSCIDELRPIANREDAGRGLKERLLRMEALQTVETERWSVGDVGALFRQVEGGDGFDERTAATVLFASGMSAVRTRRLDIARESRDGIAAVHRKMSPEDGDERDQVAIMEKELSGLVAFAEDRHQDALQAFKEATAIAESMEPPSGPPGEAGTDSPVKPAHELFGEMLLERGMHDEALARFQTSLLRTPGRVRSLLGAARAAVGSGDSSAAARYYDAIVRIPDAGLGLPGLDEARRYRAVSEEP